MKKEFIKSYIKWDKVAFFNNLKNNFDIRMYVFHDIPVCTFRSPYDTKQIFINLDVQIYASGIKHKLQNNAEFGFRYFIY